MTSKEFWENNSSKELRFSQVPKWDLNKKQQAKACYALDIVSYLFAKNIEVNLQSIADLVQKIANCNLLQNYSSDCPLRQSLYELSHSTKVGDLMTKLDPQSGMRIPLWGKFGEIIVADGRISPKSGKFLVNELSRLSSPVKIKLTGDRFKDFETLSKSYSQNSQIWDNWVTSAIKKFVAL